MIGSGETRSIWMERADQQDFRSLHENTNCDVCIVGAGITGMMTAYLLARAGRKVIVLDDGRIGSGETGRTTAHATAALDDRYYNIESMHGEDGARLAAESHLAAINRIEQICNAEQIMCDFIRVDGYLFLAQGHPHKLLEDEAEATHRAGLSDTLIVERAPLAFWNTGPCLKFPTTCNAQLHPLRFLAGLAHCMTRDGGEIYCNTHVAGIDDGEPCRVHIEGGIEVKCQHAVSATNASISDYVVTHLKQAAYRTYVIGLSVPKSTVPPILLWDTPDPYHYVRIQPESDHDVLIVGGEDHKTGHKHDMAERFGALENWTRERFPMGQDLLYYWSGQVVEPFDYLSFTGRSPGMRNVYMHSGDSGNGITHGAMAAILLSDLIAGRPNPWAELYAPSRVSLRAAPEFLRQQLDVSLQYAKWVLPGDSLDGLKPGEGRVVLRGTHRIAVYRDEQGNLHERNAACTHMKCIVDWNNLEKSWDCPCHGSRFDPYGSVLNGPAISPLQQIE